MSQQHAELVDDEHVDEPGDQQPARGARFEHAVGEHEHQPGRRTTRYSGPTADPIEKTSGEFACESPTADQAKPVATISMPTRLSGRRDHA